MASPTLTRLALAVLCLGVLVGFFVFPTYPNYDSYYSLLWGRELLDGTRPFFEGFRVPTEHPLAIFAGALLGLAGDVGDRLWIALIFASLVALACGLYRLGRTAFTPLVGLIAAGLLLSRFDFPFLAARGYIDIPYLALVIWAVALEAERPRRGLAVFVLLALAGMLRPEAWLLSGLYWLWMAVHASWGDRARWAALAAIGPLVWCAVDFAVTGHPLFSLTYTTGSAEELGRQRTLSEIPGAIPGFLQNLVKLPVFLAAVAGLVLGALLVPRRMVMPLVLLGCGIGTFVLVGVAGLSVIERYLIVAALALMLFAAVTVGGFDLLLPGTRARRVWAAASAVVVLAGAAYTITRVDLTQFRNELVFRGDAHDSLEAILASRAVRDGLRCGPLTLPNHKLVPDARWVSGLGADRVFARADTGTKGADRPDNGRGSRVRRGVALYVTSRYAMFKYALTSDSDSALVEVPPEGWRRVVVNRYFAAYVRC
ncbi:MAG TPA: hypothetical protein VF533_03140 [Solirubrobacteraceae bacterium]|jgi:hypothetical protein